MELLTLESSILAARNARARAPWCCTFLRRCAVFQLRHPFSVVRLFCLSFLVPLSTFRLTYSPYFPASKSGWRREFRGEAGEIIVSDKFYPNCFNKKNVRPTEYRSMPRRSLEEERLRTVLYLVSGIFSLSVGLGLCYCYMRAVDE